MDKSRIERHLIWEKTSNLLSQRSNTFITFKIWSNSLSTKRRFELVKIVVIMRIEKEERTTFLIQTNVGKNFWARVRSPLKGEIYRLRHKLDEVTIRPFRNDSLRVQKKKYQNLKHKKLIFSVLSIFRSRNRTGHRERAVCGRWILLKLPKWMKNFKNGREKIQTRYERACQTPVWWLYWYQL